METFMLVLMLTVSMLISWLLVGRRELEPKTLKKYVALAFGYGIANGAIFAGTIALVNLLRYHTMK